MRSAIAIALLFTFTSGTAFAQNTTVEHDFETDEITGMKLKPTEETVKVIQSKGGETLFRVRTNFVAELLKSTDNI